MYTFRRKWVFKELFVFEFPIKFLWKKLDCKLYCTYVSFFAHMLLFAPKGTQTPEFGLHPSRPRTSAEMWPWRVYHKPVPPIVQARDYRVRALCIAAIIKTLYYIQPNGNNSDLPYIWTCDAYFIIYFN